MTNKFREVFNAGPSYVQAELEAFLLFVRAFGAVTVSLIYSLGRVC